MGNAALGLQAADAAKLASILASRPSSQNGPELLRLVRLLERCSSAALSWVTGLNPGVKASLTSRALHSRKSERPRAAAMQAGEKDAKLAQKLGQLQPLMAISPQECMGQLPSFGPT